MNTDVVSYAKGKGSQCFTLVPGPDEHPGMHAQTDLTAHAAPVSVVQADRALRQGC